MPDGSASADEHAARLPAEFRGLARQFLASIEAADRAVAAAVLALIAPLEARAARSPVPRPDLLQSAARAWRETVPTRGRLGLAIDVDRKRLVVHDTRLARGGCHRPEWGDAVEPSVMIVVLTLTVAPGVLQLAAPILLATISLHALGRRYQRGADASTMAILADIGALADAHAALVPAVRPFQLPAPGGVWVGEIGVAGQAPIIAVRTFFSRED